MAILLNLLLNLRSPCDCLLSCRLPSCRRRPFAPVVHVLDRKLGNVQFNWPKLFQAFSVILSLIFFHKCIHSIIPHQYM